MPTTKEKHKILYKKATVAYTKYCKNHPGVYRSPWETQTRYGWKYVTLRNNRRELAKYDIKKDKIVP